MFFFQLQVYHDQRNNQVILVKICKEWAFVYVGDQCSSDLAGTAKRNNIKCDPNHHQTIQSTCNRSQVFINAPDNRYSRYNTKHF